MGDMAFTWKGESSDEHGIVVRSLPPIYTAQPRDETVQVPGRDGALHLQDGTYDEQLMVIEGYLPYEQGVPVSPIETIKAWLVGQGYLTLSDRPDRWYKARIVDGIAFSPFVTGFQDRIFSVSFWCDPFAFGNPDDILQLNGSGFPLVNESGITAYPIITVKGAGQIVLHVGDIGITLHNVSGSVVIDCDARLAYLQDASNAVAITLNDEKWPVLAQGATRITWSGNVQQVLVKPNWRYW